MTKLLPGQGANSDPSKLATDIVLPPSRMRITGKFSLCLLCFLWFLLSLVLIVVNAGACSTSSLPPQCHSRLRYLQKAHPCVGLCFTWAHRHLLPPPTRLGGRDIRIHGLTPTATCCRRFAARLESPGWRPGGSVWGSLPGTVWSGRSPAGLRSNTADDCCRRRNVPINSSDV